MPRQVVQMCMSRLCKEHDYEQDLQYCTWCHKRKPDFQGYIRITVNGEETYVNTLKEAFEYANGKEAEITLMQSMENTDNLPALTRGKISLDLNQKSLTEKNASLINIRGAEVTVKNGTCDIPIIREQGKLKIESGNFQILKDQSSFSKQYGNYRWKFPEHHIKFRQCRRYASAGLCVLQYRSWTLSEQRRSTCQYYSAKG